MRHIKSLLLLLCVLFVSSCYYSHPDRRDSWNIPDGHVDSMAFAAKHHYAQGFNFKVSVDSFQILERTPGNTLDDLPGDTLTVYSGNKIVVADLLKVRTDSVDSIWVKVARDQETQGWIQENKLMKNAIPDDPISSFIHSFSNKSFLIFLIFLGAALLIYLVRTTLKKNIRIVHFNDIDSFYPTLSCLCVSGAAALYGSVQEFVPQTWVEFYFHPTLNPFGLPMVLSCFIASIWLMLLAAIAVIEDVRKLLPLGEAIAYLLGLLGTCIVLYLFFTLTVGFFYIGYPLLAAYWIFAIIRYFKRHSYPYRCGRCGKKIARLGRCPHCGAINK